jgi:uncharacterized protein (DUF1800 family)
MSGWIPYRPSDSAPWNLRRVVHLHRRAGFAATWSELQRDLRDGPQASVDRLLNGKSRIDGVAESFESMASVIGDAAVGSGNVNRLKAWWLYRLLFTPDPLTERLTLMWHNHFATSNLKVENVAAMRRQNDIFRQYARGPFGELLGRVAKDPALLVWLDADANRKEHPNENLAREMMELFTLGVGHFTEKDVKESAQALTGWSIKDSEFRHADEQHDDGEKTIFGKSGKWTGDDLVRLLLEHPATARRLAFRIVEMFMGEGTRDDVAIDKLADGLRQQHLDIAWAVETVLRSESFFSDRNIGNRVLGPIEFMVGAVRSLERFDPPPSTLMLAEWTTMLGQDLFYPPNVFGWPGGRSWLTSRALIGRANFAAAIINGTLHYPQKPFAAGSLVTQHSFTQPEDCRTFYASLLLGDPQAADRLLKQSDAPERMVMSILASPEAQLA